MKSIYICTFLLLFACQNTSTEHKEVTEKIPYKVLQNGDIIFQNSQSNQSAAIELATHSDYSHMGIIFIKDNETYVLEASNIVKLTPLQNWIQHGEKNHYVVKRLKNGQELLTPLAMQKLKAAGEKHLNKKYDLYFEWSDDTMYCSELVWKMYKEALHIEIGKPNKFSSFDLSNPTVMANLKERFGNNIPLNETVISPQDMFESDILVEITSN